jgi:hypothetical protein
MVVIVHHMANRRHVQQDITKYKVGMLSSEGAYVRDAMLSKTESQVIHKHLLGF